MVETCKQCWVDPRGYLSDVLSRIVTGHLNARRDDLLPWAYATMPDLKACSETPLTLKISSAIAHDSDKFGLST
jgi:hypothetical protein